jgi:hypothetical protein
MTNQPDQNRYVICIHNEPNPVSLELRKLYRVVPDRDAEATGMIRIVDESGEDYMYPTSWFLPVELPEKVMRVLEKV